MFPIRLFLVLIRIIYRVKGQRDKEIQLENISKIIKTINSDKELIKTTVKVDNDLYIFTSMSNIDINSFADTLHNKLKDMDKDILEEIEYKEW